MRFELTIRFYPYNGLANRRLQPLGHPSAGYAGCFTTAYAPAVVRGTPRACQSNQLSSALRGHGPMPVTVGVGAPNTVRPASTTKPEGNPAAPAASWIAR